MKRSERDPARLYLAMLFFHGLFFYGHLAVFSVYVILVVGLSPFQLLILGTILEVTVLLCEVPTGVVADSVSRRASIVFGLFLIGAGFMLEGGIQTWAAVATAQVVWGLGYTFTSGAEQAWIADEVGEERVHGLYLGGEQAFNAGAIVGIVLAVAVAIVWGLPAAVLWAGAGFVVLAAGLAVTMPERDFVRLRRGERWAAVTGTVRNARAVIRVRPVLMVILVIAFLHAVSQEGFDRLYTLHLIESTPFPGLGEGRGFMVWFGLLEAVGLLLAIAGTEFIKRRVEITTNRGAARALAIMDVILGVGVLAFALSRSFVMALLLFWVITTVGSISEPVWAAWVNRGLDPRSRATINSLWSQFEALGEASAGPPLGAVATRSPARAIGLGGLVRIPATILLILAARLGERRPEEASHPPA